MKFTTLAYASYDEMIFGSSPNPVTCSQGMIIGGGEVYPEVNFTLPVMELSRNNIDGVEQIYRQISAQILDRVVALNNNGVVLEFEHLPQMTESPAKGTAIVRAIKETIADYTDKHDIDVVLRATPVDIRMKSDPPDLRNPGTTALLFESIDLNCEAGADMMAIESVGGKEICDKAIVEADISGLLLGLGILGCRDMEYLWGKIVSLCNKYGCIPSGDTACGFANTAMVLADQKYIPKVLAAVVRAMSAPRTLIALETGAVGPSKDCAYEGPILKAITGTPISMEGKTSACAHFSHLGNVAAAVCDLWSNESVQQTRLLAGNAPECFSEMLTYDCRLFNTAIQQGQTKILQRLLVESDIHYDPHAFIISPESSFKLAESIIKESTHYGRTYSAALKACELLRDALKQKVFTVTDREIKWLDGIERSLENLDTEEKVVEAIPPQKYSYNRKGYGL